MTCTEHAQTGGNVHLKELTRYLTKPWDRYSCILALHKAGYTPIGFRMGQGPFPVLSNISLLDLLSSEIDANICKVYYHHSIFEHRLPWAIPPKRIGEYLSVVGTREPNQKGSLPIRLVDWKLLVDVLKTIGGATLNEKGTRICVSDLNLVAQTLMYHDTDHQINSIKHDNLRSVHRIFERILLKRSDPSTNLPQPSKVTPTTPQYVADIQKFQLELNQLLANAPNTLRCQCSPAHIQATRESLHGQLEAIILDYISRLPKQQ